MLSPIQNSFTVKVPRFLICLYGIALAFSLQSADALTLVENGVANAPIVIFKDAPPKTRVTADELAEYFEKVTGVKPEIVEGVPSPLPDNAIWIGYQPALDKLFPDTDFDFQKPEEILISANLNHLVIAGRDRWDPDHLTVQGIDEAIEGKQNEYGTANAVYHFIQEYLGVRWIWPGDLGEDIIKKETISFEPFEFRYAPQIRGRGGMFNYSQLSNRGYGKSQDWTRLQRLQLCSLEIGGGHGFGDWWERYHETHPDIFALQPDGTRSGHPSPRNAKLCQSNPEVWDLWLEDVKHQLEEDPTQFIFNGSPNDGWSSGHCVCDDCRAWDHPDGEPRLMHWHHYREERPALSDRHVTFANKLAEKLKQPYPDKDYYVAMLSYGHSRPGPVEARPADNVIMVVVANFFGRTHLVDRGSTWGTTYRDQFDQWGKVAPHIMWRPNTGSPAGWQQGLPDLSVHQTVEDFHFIAERNCLGLYIDSVFEHWATHGPHYYAMAQLAWNPSLTADQILTDYYDRGFGPAADEVRAYYETIENARMEFAKDRIHGSGIEDFPALYNEDLLARAEAHLDAAEKLTSGADSKFAERVEFVRVGCNYTKLVIENISLMSGYWSQPDDTVAEKVRSNWNAIEKTISSHPYAINFGPVRPITPRMLGLHPDHPNPKWKVKPKKSDPNDLDQN
ncbi:MAG: hypothetical protein CMO55_02370 [Verrucomicrobiales bacterium]|nr:hypothetical protein [Verrucomicrobiales bacterium]